MDTKSTVYISSGNPDKAAEFKRILENIFPFFKNVIRIRGAKDAEETGSTYLENVKIKAFALHEELKAEGSTRHLIFADDSGLEVEGLDKRPGLYSARYAATGPHDKVDFSNNIKKILNELSKFPLDSKERDAVFKSQIYFVLFENEKIQEDAALGEVRGQIMQTLDGSDGFGYDPIFFYKPLNKTFAQISDQQRDTVTHRFRACEKFSKYADVFKNFLVH